MSAHDDGELWRILLAEPDQAAVRGEGGNDAFRLADIWPMDEALSHLLPRQDDTLTPGM